MILRAIDWNFPGLDNIPSRLPSKPKVRKELNFDEEDGKENQSDNDEDNFAKPFPVPVSRPAAVLKEPSEKEKKSLAQMILMRESLAGLPRASLSGLFRQSLSIAELDRMFEVLFTLKKRVLLTKYLLSFFYFL